MYKLSESIRDLLLINPKNIEIRNQISESLKRRKEKIIEQTKKNQQLGLSQFDEEFVSNETDSTVHGLIVDLNKFFSTHYTTRNHNDLIELKTRFADLLRYKSNDHQLLYHYSRILKELKDKPGELEILNKAEKINSELPKIKIAIALHHFYKSDYEEALKVFKYLLSKKFDDPKNSSNKFSFSITKLHFLCLLYLGKYDEIISITENWEVSPVWKVMYGVYRASALKRSVEFSRLSDTDTENTILKSIEIFEKIFISENYQDVACIEANKLIKEIEVLTNTKNFSEKFIFTWVNFISTHFFNILSILKNESISSLENQKFLERIYNLKLVPNPLHSVKWYVNQIETTYDREHITELIVVVFKFIISLMIVALEFLIFFLRRMKRKINFIYQFIILMKVGIDGDLLHLIQN
jgi:tetratricopeptide (TPR) repeat protein